MCPKQVRSTASEIESDLQLAIQRFIAKTQQVEDKQRVVTDKGLPRLRLRVYEGSLCTGSMEGVGAYGDRAPDYTAPSPTYLPASGRRAGPIGMEDTGAAPNFSSYDQMIFLSNRLISDIKQALGIDVLRPSSWARVVQDQIEKQRVLLQGGSGSSGDQFREAMLDYLLLWEKLLVFQLPPVCATMIALRWDWNMEAYDRVQLGVIEAVEAVNEEIQNLGYQYVETPMVEWVDGKKKLLAEADSFVHKDSEAGRAMEGKPSGGSRSGLRGGSRSGLRGGRKLVLEKNILSSTYGIDWSHGFDFNFKAHHCLQALKKQLGILGAEGVSDPVVSPVLSGGDRDIQLAFDNLVYAEEVELDWWKETIRAPHGLD